MSHFKLLIALPLFAALTACSENTENEDYQSAPPTFSDVTFRNLTRPNDETFHVGDRIEATAVQSKKGKLLYKSEYVWTTNNEDQTTHNYYKGGIYDKDTRDPKDTLTVTAAGNYDVTLTATYGISGQYSPKYSGTTYFADGNGSVTYKTGGSVIAGYNVTVTKRLYVRN